MPRGEANKAEAERRSDLSDVDREWEDEQTRAEKWLKERELNRRRLAVRIGRKAWNYGISLSVMCVTTHAAATLPQPCSLSHAPSPVFAPRPTTFTEQCLEQVNAEIAKVMPEDGIDLSADEALMWIPHSVPLDKEAIKYYNAGAKLSAYQSITKDMYELLLIEDEEMANTSRFVCLEGSVLTDAQLLAQVMRHGPFTVRA